MILLFLNKFGQISTNLPSFSVSCPLLQRFTVVPCPLLFGHGYVSLSLCESGCATGYRGFILKESFYFASVLTNLDAMTMAKLENKLLLIWFSSLVKGKLNFSFLFCKFVHLIMRLCKINWKFLKARGRYHFTILEAGEEP